LLQNGQDPIGCFSIGDNFNLDVFPKKLANSSMTRAFARNFGNRESLRTCIANCVNQPIFQ